MDTLIADLPATIEARPTGRRLWTKEEAVAFAAKGNLASRLARQKLKEDAAKLRQVTPDAERLARQVKKVEELIEDSDDADELQKLSACHARLFSAWQVLTGTPNPGSRKSSRGPSRSLPAIAPLDPEPGQQVPPLTS